MAGRKQSTKTASFSKSSTRKRAVAKPSGKPRLLSGGNPKITKGDGDGPVQAYIAAMPGWKRDIGKRLDALIVRSVPTPPGARKAMRWNSPFYGVNDPSGSMGWFLSMHCVTKYVKVAFFRGSSLRPPPPVESRMKNVRYFHIFEGDKLDEALLTDWVQQAAALPGTDCF